MKTQPKPDKEKMQKIINDFRAICTACDEIARAALILREKGLTAPRWQRLIDAIDQGYETNKKLRKEQNQ